MDILWILWILPTALAVEGKIWLPRFGFHSILARVYGYGTLCIERLPRAGDAQSVFSLKKEEEEKSIPIVSVS